MSKEEQKKTTIGGQALIEGVMMKGVSVGAMAVRKKDGSIYTEEWELKEKKWYNKALFIRGCINFVSQLREGYSCIMKSSEISGAFEEGEPTGFDRFMVKTFGEKGADRIAGAIGAILSFIMVAAMLAVFLFLPSYLFTLLEGAVSADISGWKSAFEGVMKLALFIAYMAIVAQTKDIRRTYEYHGAEHKTIACYEAKKELTVENVRPMTRFHPRCGTSFIIITLLVSILVYSIVPIEPGIWFGIENKVISTALRVLIKLPFLPIVVGISYELIRLAGRHSNIFTKIISAPGLWTQRLTTREPDDKQIEIAIAAMTPCLPKENENDNW
ncbi:MAG: DUF1385 domain-containing protein [Oscillospiraceae bacterium]|nr:DUF1385 domain-containing protein [Oscillospiraceae bacterium]